MSKAKPDDRSNNKSRIERNIASTIHNMELADEMIHKTDDHKMKKVLKEKNARREKALEAMRREIKDEAPFADKGD